MQIPKYLDTFIKKEAILKGEKHICLKEGYYLGCCLKCIETLELNNTILKYNGSIKNSLKIAAIIVYLKDNNPRIANITSLSTLIKMANNILKEIESKFL